MDTVDEFKLAAAVFIWVLALVGGIAPLLSTQRVSKRVSSIFNMAAAGIFLASSCMHLLPDAQNNVALTEWGCKHTIEDLLTANSKGEGKSCFNWANFFYGSGFLMILLIEVTAHSLQRNYNKVHGCEQEERESLITVDTCAVEVNNFAKESLCSRSQLDCGEYGTCGASIELAALADGVKKEIPSHSHGIVDGNLILALVIFIALSFHSVMEGMGMGASSSPAWDILIAVMAHKSLAAFALVLEFLHHNVPTKQLILTVAVFSLMTPTGILFGRLLIDSNHATPASGICAALAGGTFLFVATIEIIPQELKDPQHQLEKFAVLLLGYGTMGMLSIWT
ncbi:uncharacterized protein CCR75_003428 [Bremia lactucae]|uniref:Uncharacterized protein n=1 Tax=Bremia lactucae TaxID=4779 RepID=A0A976IIA4_BRELC|nr:hypothetical protein CCR75_003428 [Bremia lactucae]